MVDLPMTSVSSQQAHETIVNMVLKRSRQYTLVHDYRFNNEELDPLLMSQEPLYYFKIAKDCRLITDASLTKKAFSQTKATNLTDQPYLAVRYQSKKIRERGQKIMQIKVVGTSFAFQEYGPKSFDDFAGEVSHGADIPVKTAPAVLIKEPSNPHDPNAVRVVVSLTNGQSFPIGYLPKTINKSVELDANGKKVVQVKIVGYSTLGAYNDSFIAIC